jgi:hypothetical protein
MMYTEFPTHGPEIPFLIACSPLQPLPAIEPSIPPFLDSDDLVELYYGDY